jgi:hypothetical protein
MNFSIEVRLAAGRSFTAHPDDPEYDAGISHRKRHVNPGAFREIFE